MTMTTTITNSAGSTSSKGVSNYDDGQLAQAYADLKDRNPYFQHDSRILETILTQALQQQQQQQQEAEDLTFCDLACGSGYYARYFRDRCPFDFYSIVGVDISKDMIDAAVTLEEKDSPSKSPKIQYVAGNVNDAETIHATLQANGGRKFDVANAAFLINYFGTEDELVQVIRSAKSLLKAPTGRFMGMTQNPWLNCNEPTALNVQRFGLAIDNLGGTPPKDGDLIAVHISNWDQTNQTSTQQLKVVYWTSETYERAFFKAGMKLEWVTITKNNKKKKSGDTKQEEEEMDESEKAHWAHHPTIAFCATMIGHDD